MSSPMFAEYAEKLGKPVDYFEKRFQAILTELKKIYPDTPEEQLRPRAKFMVYREIKQELRSPAIAFEGIVIGVSPLRDITAPMRAQALEMYRTDPLKAIQEGYVDSQGNPLDNRPTLPDGRTNPWYGKPLNPVFVSEVYVIGKHYGKSEPQKLIIVQQMGERAKLKPELFSYVVFRAIERASDPSRIIARASSVTSYQKIPKKDLDVPSLLRSVPEQMKVGLLSELESWHNNNLNDYLRLCVVEGDVLIVRNEPTSAGNKMLVIEDESIMGIESEGVTIWVPQDIELNFGPGSHVLVVGRTVQGPGWNPETRSIDSSVTRIMINAFGVYPEFTVPVGIVQPAFDYEVEV